MKAPDLYRLNFVSYMENIKTYERRDCQRVIVEVQ